MLDIDGDGRSDRNLVRSMLVASGGQIDYEVHDDGSTEGELKAGIRYLVLGSSPADRDAANVDRKVVQAYSDAQRDAQQLGIEIISVDKMLDWAGYRPEVRTRTVGLGENADPAQFKPGGDKSPTATNPVPEQFRERRPSDKQRGKAYPKASAP